MSIAELVLLGIWCGLIALFFIETMNLTHKSFDRFIKNRILKAAVGGALLILYNQIASPRYLGLGLETLDAGWKGNALPMGAFFWKILATSITLGSGGSGGVVTPIFFIGTQQATFLPSSSTRSISQPFPPSAWWRFWQARPIRRLRHP